MDSSAADSILRLSEELSPRLRGPDAEAALLQLQSRYSDIVAAVSVFIDQERQDEALRLANALYRFWITRQRFEDGASVFDHVLRSPHMAWPPDERPQYERLLAVLPEALGSALFERARAAGHSMGSRESVDFALGRSNG